MPRPDFVRELVYTEDLDSEGNRQLDAAIRFAAALQEKADLDIITDREK